VSAGDLTQRLHYQVTIVATEVVQHHWDITLLLQLQVAPGVCSTTKFAAKVAVISNLGVTGDHYTTAYMADGFAPVQSPIICSHLQRPGVVKLMLKLLSELQALL
jgi:hypothetical protein